MNGHRGGGAFIAIACLVLLLAFALAPPAAHAYHDQGYPCYQCHSLKPSEIRTGSNAIRWDQPVLTPVPVSPSGSQAWSGGMPITCDFCHRATDDVPIANFASKTYRHPVRTISDNGALPNEIACGDCHNGDVNGNAVKDLSPATMATKTTSDGYPDHDNVTAGYAHNLASNPPHLTVPYWSGASLPGVTRSNDTTFWTNVRLGTQDMVCWVCHEGAGRTNAPTRAPMTNRTSTQLVRQDYVGTGRARGHQIRTNAGGSQLGVGAALPCYDCHDSHGSLNAGFILDNQSIYGASTSQVAITAFTGANDLVVCAQCHDTGNAVTATTRASGDGRQVEGLYPVDPYNSAVYSAMHVDSGTADNMLLSTRTCLANNGGCHANPHNPLGESGGGLNCGVCHGSVLSTMDSGSSTGYHHVLMADNAPIGGLYPTNPTPTSTATDRMCIVCHVDHTLFSPQVNPSYFRGRNLRRDITQQPDNITNTPLSTDYDNSLARGGICTSCHENRQTKRNPGTDIKADGSTYTPMVSKGIFGASAHNYPTVFPYLESRFRSDNTLFQSNCAKCHNDTSAKKFQDNTIVQFSLHASDGVNAVNKLLAPLGYTPLTDNLTENFCYRCHSHATDAIAGTRKGTDGRDWYSNQAMSAASEGVWGEFQRASRHPVSTADQAGGTRVVDCLNCHNVHLVGRPSDNTMVSNPDNTYASVAGWHADGTGPAAQSAFCLSCHDGTPPAYQLTTNVYIPADVRVSSPRMNKTAYAARAHWTGNQGQIFGTAGLACTTCHDKHGGSFGKLLDNSVGYHNVPVTPSGLCLVCHGFTMPSPASGNNNTYCFRCHTQEQGDSPNGYPPTEADRNAADNGYFSLAPTPTRFAVRWPGRATYEGALSAHGTSATTFPGFDNVSRPVASCNTCHDVHGTANQFNELKETFRPGNYTLCFRCHGRTATATDNISRYYPAASGGDNADSTASTNVGHNVKTSGGYLAPATSLPCYDCHGIHGSTTGNTQLKSDERWSGVGNTKYGATPSDGAADNASRTFCLGCHTAIDNAVAGTVENLNRQAGRLKLPAANPIAEHYQASSQGCQRCHYGYTYLDNTFGPHYPGTGLCDTCHESQGARSAAAATYNGAHRTHTDNTLYRFACKQCHSWTAPVSPAVHKNDDNTAAQHAEVRFDNQAVAGWSLIQYATPTQYEYRSIYASPFGAAASPSYTRGGTDNTTPDARRASVRWTNGTCGQVWCHSNANPIGGLGATNVYQGPAWVDNALRTDCTGCHGGDRTAAPYLIGDNASALNGSVAHRKHVAGNIGCYKCHSGTVQTPDNRLISVLDNHVNGVKDVKFSPDVAGVWDNGNKTCSATYCHGTPPTLPKWDNLATVTGCGACHQNQGAGATPTYAGPHHPHTINAKLRIACEACHAALAVAHAETTHAGGRDNAATGKTAEVLFSDNGANQSYDNVAFLSKNMWLNPYDNSAPMTPLYVGGASYVGNDSVNPALSWTQGTCTNVWCHSNAKPLGWKGVAAQNVLRAPTWNYAGCTNCHNPRPNDINCTPCHRGRATAIAMAGTDNLSGGHITHVATDRYNFTCDECHAWTVPNDSDGQGGLGIIVGTGHDNHVDGVKTVRFSTTLRTTAINESGGAYDNGAYRCYNTYCHSNGTDNATFNTPAQWPRDNAIAWNSATGGTCATCHNYTAASGFPMATLAHDNHVNNAAALGANYACYRCHTATVNASDNVNSYTNHVNGSKDVAFSDCAATAKYASATKTCSNTSCHRQGNRALGGAQDNLAIAWDNMVDTSCKTCHGSRTGTGYTQFGTSLLGEPNYDNGAFGGGQSTANSHARHVVATDNTTKCSKCHPDVSPTVLNTLASDNYAMHINDNVEVRGGNGASFTWAAGTHQCSNVSCHGGGTAVWGASLNCAACHVGTGDLDDFGNGSGPASLSGNGWTARIDNAEWLYSGHGKPSGTYDVSGRSAAAFGGTNACAYCHDATVAHDNVANPFRLANFNFGSLGWNGNCMICHRKSGGSPGYNYPDGPAVENAAARVDSNHYNPGNATNARHSSTYNGGKFCWDCHDPHGDRTSGGGNIFMVGSRVAMRTDNVFGFPVASFQGDNTYRPAPVFTGNAGGANYASTDNAAPYDGICEVCHQGSSGILHYVNTGRLDSTHFTSKCTVCHTHDAGFRGVGGQDIEQYFDGAYNAASATPGQENYDDRSRHPLTNGTTSASLLFGGAENCLGCHGAKYRSSGVTHYSNECLKCHFENVSGSNPALDATRHMNRVIELSTVTGNGLPGSQYTIGTLAQYDTWCLQCHGGTTITLGGVAPSAAQGTYIDNAAFANGRHRARTVGCIYCHQPHGRSNVMAVRENPQNRRSAGVVPMTFGVYPADNTGSYGVPANQNLPFRARQYWGNGSLPHLPETEDDQGFCNMACHIARLDSTYAKDKIILRDGTTGNYVLTPANRKIYVVNSVQYTIDNIINLVPNSHQHPNGDIITTDNMVAYYAGRNNISGPSYYRYPLAGDAHPSSYNPAVSDLPLTPDYLDGSRDFTNAYDALGVRIGYRPSCSTCHNPHGNALPNAPAGDGYPDLRLRKNNPNTLCLRCHE